MSCGFFPNTLENRIQIQTGTLDALESFVAYLSLCTHCPCWTPQVSAELTRAVSEACGGRVRALTLVTLDLSRNALRHLPWAALADLESLELLDCSRNALRSLAPLDDGTDEGDTRRALPRSLVVVDASHNVFTRRLIKEKKKEKFWAQQTLRRRFFLNIHKLFFFLSTT